MNRKTVWLFVLTAVFAVCVYGQQFNSEADFTWKKTGNDVIITKYQGTSKDVRIPSHIQGMAVIKIGNGAFAGKQLTSITIPNTVTAIEEHAFSDNQLSSVTIPNSVTVIWDYSFYKNKLTSLAIPDSVTSINIAAFAENPLTSITIGEGVDKLEERMFGIASLRNIQQISIGANVSLFALFLRENSVVWIDFMNAYHSNDQRAGIYSMRNNIWSFQPR